MEPLDELRWKLDRLPKTDVRAALEAVVRHLEVAEEHYERAREQTADDWFNDAVYRANQAYEGSLRVAWKVLMSGDSSRKKTHQLEKGLTESGILTERTRKYLELYRKEWRNPSTHDHEAHFGQQDAFVAIWSAVVFATVLADQIIERQAEGEAESKLSQDAPETVDEKVSTDWLIRNLQEFVASGTAFVRNDGTRRSEPETLGWLTAFLRVRNRRIEFERHPRLPSGGRPDLIFTTDSDRIVVEVKNGRPGRFVESAKAQLLRYVEETDAGLGILLLAAQDDEPVTASVDVYQTNQGKLHKLILIGPARWVG